MGAVPPSDPTVLGTPAGPSAQLELAMAVASSAAPLPTGFPAVPHSGPHTAYCSLVGLTCLSHLKDKAPLASLLRSLIPSRKTPTEDLQ